MRIVIAEGFFRELMQKVDFQYIAWPGMKKIRWREQFILRYLLRRINQDRTAIKWPRQDTIFYIQTPPGPEMIKHEKKHLEQYKRDGVFKYFFRYWMQYLQYGYAGIDYVIEAKKAERN